MDKKAYDAYKQRAYEYDQKLINDVKNAHDASVVSR